MRAPAGPGNSALSVEMPNASENEPRRNGGSLRYRFLLLFLLIFLGGAAATYGAVVWFTQDIVNTLLGWYAEKNVLYEKSKVFEVLLPDVALARKMASSPVLKEWVASESDPRIKARAIAELEDYRSFFRSKSYFFAIASSGNYYYNDENGGHDLRRPRYTLSRSIPKDEWFYSTLRRVDDHELNVDTDRHLGVTKVWINTVLRVEGVPLAVIGTGVDLSDFIRSVVSNAVPGVTNMLLDRDGAIQAHQDVSRIDFASIARRKRDEKQSTIFSMIDAPQDHAKIVAAFAELSAGTRATRVLDLTIQDQRYVAGISYLPELKWFLLTLSHPSAAEKRYYAAAVAGVLIVALALTLLLAGFVFDRLVLRRLALLDAAVSQLARANYELALPVDGSDEVGRLGRTLKDMASKVDMHTKDLERQVMERTQVLERLAYADFLTGLLNRRGAIDRIEVEKNRLARQSAYLGIMILDLDYFKSINDRHGHNFGDRVLAHVAATIRETMRSYDLCARWGGEEFLVVLPGLPDVGVLAATAEKLRARIKERALVLDGVSAGLTVSIGCHLAGSDESIDQMIKAADDALYAAKQQGRDRVVTAARPAEAGPAS